MRYLRRVAILAAVLASAALSLGAPAGAHSGEQPYVYLDIFDDHIEGRVEFPVTQLNDVLGLSIPQGREGATAVIEADLDRIQRYADTHLAIGDGLTGWPIEFDDFHVLAASSGTYGVFEFEVLQRFDSAPRKFTVSFDGIIEADDEVDAFLLIASDWGTGVFANEADSLLRYTAGNTTQVVDLDDSSWWKGMRAVLDLGVDHIESGTDHILFVIALVLPAVLVFRPGDGWQPAPSFGSSLWRVLKIVTMFTLAHSITLTLGGLGIVELPAKPVEVFIALSIAAAALHNLRPTFSNREWLLAFAFGLFHGLGFAGLLSELGLDRRNRFHALLGFNLGIEIGQAVIILLLFPVLFILRRTRWYEPLFKLISIGLSIVAGAWAAERLFGRNLQVNRLVDPVVVWPRALWAMVIVGIGATALYFWEARRKRLRPLSHRIDDDRGVDEPVEAEL